MQSCGTSGRYDSYVNVNDILTGSNHSMAITEPGDWFIMVDMSDCTATDPVAWDANWFNAHLGDAKYKNVVGIEVLHQVDNFALIYLFVMGCGVKTTIPVFYDYDSECVAFDVKLAGE